MRVVVPDNVTRVTLPLEKRREGLGGMIGGFLDDHLNDDGGGNNDDDENNDDHERVRGEAPGGGGRGSGAEPPGAADFKMPRGGGGLYLGI